MKAHIRLESGQLENKLGIYQEVKALLELRRKEDVSSASPARFHV